LTAGTTWHAAGLIVSGFTTDTDTFMAKYTRDLYERLHEETGQETGFKAVGYMQIASNPERLDSLRRRADTCRAYGVIAEEISAADINRMWPLFHTDDMLAGFYTPEDGRTNPMTLPSRWPKGPGWAAPASWKGPASPASIGRTGG
jgi:glycine/D-amino acid oxidase-like deaminating enzyme